MSDFLFKRDYLNYNKAVFYSDSSFGIPNIPTQYKLKNIDVASVVPDPFNVFRSKRSPGSVPHFFIDDYVFQCVWNSPSRYIDMFSSVPFIFGFDFSLYANMPCALRIFNKYRNNWLCCFYISKGVTVLPCVLFSSVDDFDFIFDGIPALSPVCVTTQSFKDSELLKKNIDFLLTNKKPTQIIVYGDIPDYLSGDNRFVSIPTFSDIRFGGGKNGK